MLLDMLLGKDWAAGGDPTHHRQPRTVLVCLQQTDTALRPLLELDGAMPRQRLEMINGGIDGAETERELCWNANVIAVENLVYAARKTGARIAQVSTDYVFDGTKGALYTPDDTPNPLNEYGRSKLTGEQYINEILE